MPAQQSSQQNAPVQQIIEGRYIERDKLMTLLEDTFGKGNFALRVWDRCGLNDSGLTYRSFS